MTLFTPSLVKSILKGRRATTAPGEDGLMFGVLSKLPSSDHFLATLYNKVDEQTIAPTSWTGCKIFLSHKDGSTEEPSNFRPIALASILGKIYHQVKAGKMTDFMIENGYIDPATQKAFMQNINGCVEHIQVIQELIQDAKASNKTLHATFFDLLDCFGSISHQLIQFCLEHYHVPEKERSCILSLYSQLHGKVVTKEWESEPFKFLKGVYQGDNYSAIIFLVVFQPLISYLLSHKESSGYMLGERKIITKPFADDFECLTRNKKTHQKLMLDLQVKAEAMGLTFKPSKCRTLSIQGGTVKPCSFYLLDKDGVQTPLATLEDDPTKFLGSSLTHQNTPADHHKFLQAKLESKLSNLDKAEVRGEYKVAVYTRYALPSLRFHLSVHNIHKTHLAQLDATARRYIKQWLDFPSRGASDISLFHPGIIGLKQPSQLYLEGHLGAHIQSSILGDPDTQEAIKNRLARERQWTNKSSTTVECQEMFETLDLDQYPPRLQDNPGHVTTIRLEMPVFKAAANVLVKAKVLEASQTQSRELVLQGEFARLLEEEKSCIDWQGLIHSLPRGLLSFAARLTSNTLASPDNLARWRKVVDPRCKLCDHSPCTLFHLLSDCPTALKQGRYDYRHDSVLAYLYSVVRRMKSAQVEVYCDLDGGVSTA